jgi:hypothetical protein
MNNLITPGPEDVNVRMNSNETPAGWYECFECEKVCTMKGHIKAYCRKCVQILPIDHVSLADYMIERITIDPRTHMYPSRVRKGGLNQFNRDFKSVFFRVS